MPRLLMCRLHAVVLAAVIGASCSPPAEETATEDADAPGVESPTEGSAEQVVGGQARVVGGGLVTVVMLLPASPPPMDPAARPSMDQINLTFVPSLLLVQTGQPVTFRNSEDVLHNVRVRHEETKEGTFNVALPSGGTYEHAFERDGFYDVGCDIHPGMSALIIAASTPYATLADKAGAFTIPNVPPGSYTAVTLVAGERTERAVQIGAGRTDLDLSGS